MSAVVHRHLDLQNYKLKKLKLVMFREHDSKILIKIAQLKVPFTLVISVFLATVLKTGETSFFKITPVTKC